MTETIMAAVPAATTLAAPVAHAQPPMRSGKGIPTISAWQRGAQAARWAAHAQRQADRRMAGCRIQPECRGGRTMSATAASQG